MRLSTYRRAGAVVIDGDRVLLVSLHPPGEKRWWMFPGGGVEDGETAEEAAVRELREETGLVAGRVTPYLRAGIHGGHHEYFLADCADTTIGAVTGPEVDEVAFAGFRAEWVPISALAAMPVMPLCVAEQVASGSPPPDGAPWVDDDRFAWEGIPGAVPPAHIRITVRAVVVVDGSVAMIERVRGDDRWWTLPGGGVDHGESAADAVVREVREELGLDVEPVGTPAVVEYRRAGKVSLQTYLTCRVVGGVFGSGCGDEYGPLRQDRGTYRPVWVDPAALPAETRPAWLADRLPGWLAEPAPARPERFVEHHDDPPGDAAP